MSEEPLLPLPPRLVAHELGRVESLIRSLAAHRHGLEAAQSQLEQYQRERAELVELRLAIKEFRHHLLEVLRTSEVNTPAIKLAANFMSDWEMKNTSTIKDKT